MASLLAGVKHEFTEVCVELDNYFKTSGCVVETLVGANYVLQMSLCSINQIIQQVLSTFCFWTTLIIDVTRNEGVAFIKP